MFKYTGKSLYNRRFGYFIWRGIFSQEKAGNYLLEDLNRLGLL
jgi:hypothetical protein